MITLTPACTPFLLLQESNNQHNYSQLPAYKYHHPSQGKLAGSAPMNFNPFVQLYSVRATTRTRRDDNNVQGMSFSIHDQFVLFFSE